MSTFVGFVGLAEFLSGAEATAASGAAGRHFCQPSPATWVDGSAVVTLSNFLHAATLPGYQLLVVVQSDVDQGGLPDILVATFADPHWHYGLRFHIPEVSKLDTAETFRVAMISFELPDHDFLSRVLRSSSGWLWSANLAVWGVQVPDDWVGETLTGLGRRPMDRSLSVRVRTAFRLNSNMTELHIYCAPGAVDGAPRLANYLALSTGV